MLNLIVTSVGVQSLTISSNPRISPKNIVTHSNSSSVCCTSPLQMCELTPPSLSPDPSSCPAPARAAENRGRLSLSVVSGCQAPGLFPRVAWKTPKTLTAADTHPSAVNFLRMNQLGRSEQRGVKTTLIIKSFPVLTHPNDGQRVLDKEVEYQGDDADEGQDGHPDILSRLRRIQLILSDISK